MVDEYIIPLKRLKQYNPFKSTVWDGLKTPITKKEVQEAIRESNCLETPLVPFSGTREQHVARIAFLATNLVDWQHRALLVDVGVPSLGFFPNWIIEDGNHRLAAAFYLGLKRIKVSPCGDVALIKRLLGIDLEE